MLNAFGNTHGRPQPLTEVIRGVVRDVIAARRGVGNDEHDAVLGGVALGAGLRDEVLLGASQAGEPVEDRARALGDLRRQSAA